MKKVALERGMENKFVLFRQWNTTICFPLGSHVTKLLFYDSDMLTPAPSFRRAGHSNLIYVLWRGRRKEIFKNA